MSTFEHKNGLRTIEAQIVQKLKNNEARPKFAGSYIKKKRVIPYNLLTKQGVSSERARVLVRLKWTNFLAYIPCGVPIILMLPRIRRSSNKVLGSVSLHTFPLHKITHRVQSSHFTRNKNENKVILHITNYLLLKSNESLNDSNAKWNATFSAFLLKSNYVLCTKTAFFLDKQYMVFKIEFSKNIKSV